MSTDLAIHSGGPPAPDQWATYKEMTQLFLETEFVPKALRGRKEAVLAAIVSGHELGIGPMQALKHIAIVDGKPAPSAELMVALVRRAGHSIQGSVGDSQATCHGKRHDNGDEFTVIWTIEMAGRAGLRNKANWRNYPEAMLWARAVSQLCRTLFPDVIAGMGHTPEELGAAVDEDGQVIEAQVVEKSEAGSLTAAAAAEPTATSMAGESRSADASAAPPSNSGEVTDAGAQPATQADAVPVASPDQSQKSQGGAGGEASAPSGSLSETVAELCPDRKSKNIALRTAVRLATEYEGVKPPASFDQVLEMDDEPVLSRLVEELRKKFAGAAA